jgi:ribosomal protein bL25 (Ctc-form)
MIEYFDAIGRRDMTVVSPDAGGVERARAFAKRLNSPLAIIDKRRTDVNVAEVMHIIGDVEGRHCLIVDDLIDTAGTLVKAAEALLEKGALSVTACATHAVLSGEAVERIEASRILEVVVTNSIPLTDEASRCSRIKTLSVAPLLARAIQSIHERGKNEARRLRVRGMAPAVVYGAGKDAVPVSVSPKEINRILHSRSGHNTIFNVQIGQVETTPVMIVDWQNDPVRENLLHVDMKRVDMTKSLRVKVPVMTSGEARGVKEQGGLLEVITREVEIECLPVDIPEQFDVDVAGLMLNQSVRASELVLSGSVKLVSPADQVLAHVVALKAEAVVEPAVVEGAAPAAAEPEVIKKGKKEEEGAADEKKKPEEKKKK